MMNMKMDVLINTASTHATADTEITLFAGLAALYALYALAGLVKGLVDKQTGRIPSTVQQACKWIAIWSVIGIAALHYLHYAQAANGIGEPQAAILLVVNDSGEQQRFSTSG